MRSAAQDLTTPAGWGSTTFSPKVEKPKRKDSLLEIDPRHLRWVPGLIERRNCHESGFASLFPKRSPGGSVAAEVLLGEVRKKQQVTSSHVSAAGYDASSSSANALVSPRCRGPHFSTSLEPLTTEYDRSSRFTETSERSAPPNSLRDSAGPLSARLSSSSRLASSPSQLSKQTGLSDLPEQGTQSPRKRPPLERLREELGMQRTDPQPSMANSQKVRSQWLAAKEPAKPSGAVYKKRVWQKKKQDLLDELGPVPPEVARALEQHL
mmetsp:Transcript_638/g.1290  ORF Transcript_638/g.1290 Transcript_638/m.1290 type:complete len:266 (-) Transcript_638:23-820(-)